MTRLHTTATIRASKQPGKPNEKAIVCLTAYTAPIARIADSVADILLVGDSLGMVLYGFDSTLPVTREMMAAHGAAVVRSSSKALVVMDMPFGSYQESPAQAFHNAAWLLQQTGAHAIKLEGGVEMAETIAFLTARGIPVMAHIGLKPQHVHQIGGYRYQGRNASESAQVVADAKAIEKAGAFCVVLESVEQTLAGKISGLLSIPTIGIGASTKCDGQVLVTEDILALSGDHIPKFVKQYLDGEALVTKALGAFAADVRARKFPTDAHCFKKK